MHQNCYIMRTFINLRVWGGGCGGVPEDPIILGYEAASGDNRTPRRFGRTLTESWRWRQYVASKHRFPITSWCRVRVTQEWNPHFVTYVPVADVSNQLFSLQMHPLVVPAFCLASLRWKLEQFHVSSWDRLRWRLKSCTVSACGGVCSCTIIHFSLWFQRGAPSRMVCHQVYPHPLPSCSHRQILFLCDPFY